MRSIRVAACLFLSGYSLGAYWVRGWISLAESLVVLMSLSLWQPGWCASYSRWCMKVRVTYESEPLFSV